MWHLFNSVHNKTRFAHFAEQDLSDIIIPQLANRYHGKGCAQQNLNIMQYDMLLAIVGDIKEMTASAFLSSQCVITIKHKEFSIAYTSGSDYPGISQAMGIKL
jgi:hypothetical protein